MTSPSGSPFAAFGTVAQGDRFYGRDAEVAVLVDRLLVGRSSAALVGLPRIGKSSIAKRVQEKTEAEAAEIGVHWVTASVAADGLSLIVELLHAIDPDAHGYEDPEDLSAAHRRVKRVLLRAGRSGQRFVVIFDEFDAVRHWTDGSRTMHLLRDLIYDPARLPLAGLFVCRRPIDRLEQELAGISTFAGVVQQVFVRQLGGPDLAAMSGRALRTAPSAGQVLSLTGGHPFLAERALHAVFTGTADDFVDYYQSLDRFLSDEGLQARLVARVAGLKDPIDVESDFLLNQYGLLADGAPFSEHFTEYLQHVSLDLNLWGEFGVAERSVRELLDRCLTAKFGVSWLLTYKDRHSRSASPVVEGALDRRAQDARKWPRAAERSLIDYTYPRDLLTILEDEWEHVEMPKKYRNKGWWNERLHALSRVRAPLAHERGDILEPAEVALVRYHCQGLAEACRAAVAQ